jgi:hypothetical protein
MLFSAAWKSDFCFSLPFSLLPQCAGIHRNLGVHHSKVRSIELDTTVWDDEMINFMKGQGNEKARKRYERRAPVFYVRPKEYDLSMIRERWIRAKYEKKLFLQAEAEDGGPIPGSSGSVSSPAPAASPASPTSRSSASSSVSSLSAASLAAAHTDPSIFLQPERATEGWLLKENKNGKWQKRWFQLWGRELHYFKDAGDSYEKGRLDVVHCKLLIPDCSGSSNQANPNAPAGHRFLFELVSTEQDRAYPLAAESEDEMFAWLHAIRRAIIFYTKIAKGEEAGGMLSTRIPDLKVPYAKLGTVAKKGFLSKQGGGWASWNKRFFVLTKDTLYYYKSSPSDIDTPEGAIVLDAADVQFGEDKIKKKSCFTILTPDRTYFIQAGNDAEMHEWLVTLKAITDEKQNRRPIDFADSALR